MVSPKTGLGVGPECGLWISSGHGSLVHEGALDAHPLQGDGEQVEGAAVDARAG